MKKALIRMGMVMASMFVSVASFAQTNESGNGNVKSDGAKCETNAPVMKVIERKGTTSAAGTTATGEVVSVSKTDFANQSANWYSEVRQGKRLAYDPAVKDMTDQPRADLSVSVGAGGLYRVEDKAFQPQGTLTATYSPKSFIFEVFGMATRIAYPDGADAEGEYYWSTALGAGLGYKLWQSKDYNSFLAIVVHGAYQHHKTDEQKAEYYRLSANDGMAWDACLRYGHNLGKCFRIEVELGAGRQAGNLTGRVADRQNYDVSQDWHVWDVRAQIKLAWRLPIQ